MVGVDGISVGREPVQQPNTADNIMTIIKALGRRFTQDKNLMLVAAGTFILVGVLVLTSGGKSLERLESENLLIEGLSPEDMVQPIPRGVNVVIIGDSLSRYSYLSLVYFLRWGRWFEPTLEKSNLVCEHSFHSLFHGDDFGEFYFQTGRMIQPYELCDCHQKKDDEAGQTHIENRYYHDPQRNNTVTFIHAGGDDILIHGRIPAKEAYNIDKWDWHREEKGLIRHEYKEPDWKVDSWAALVKEYLSKLKPKPDHVIFHAGHWTKHFGDVSKDHADDFIAALKELGVKKVIWKGTPFGVSGKSVGEDVTKTDSHVCKKVNHCPDVSWTKHLNDIYYWDDRHFYEPVYRAMNEDLLEVMGHLPVGYAKINKKLMYSGHDSPYQYLLPPLKVDNDVDNDDE